MQAPKGPRFHTSLIPEACCVGGVVRVAVLPLHDLVSRLIPAPNL